MRLASLLFCALVSWPVASARETEPDFRIGAILPLSGGMAPYGKEVLQGMESALAQFKLDDPQRGARVSLVVEDNHGLVQDTSDAARELINKKRVHFLAGPIIGSSSEAAAQAAKDLKRPLILPAMAANKLSGAGQTTFRTSLTEADQGAALAQFAARGLRVRTVVILNEEKNTYGDAVSAGFSQAWTKLGGEVIATLSYSRKTEDFSKEMTRLLELKPGAILAPGSVATVARLMTQAKTSGVKAPFLGADSWDSQDLPKLAGEAFRGHYYLTHFSPLDPSETVKRFVSAYRQKYETDPTALAAMGYDAMRVAIETFIQAQGNMPTLLLKTLPTLNAASTLFGRLTFTKDGRAQKPGVILVTTSEGARFMTHAAPETGP